MLTIDRQILLNAVADVSRYVPRNATALLTTSDEGELLLRTTSEDCSGVERLLPGIEGDSDEFAVSLATLHSVLRFAEGRELKLRAVGEHLVVTSERASHTLPLSDDVPEAPELPDGTAVSFGPATLSGLLARVGFAAAKAKEGQAWAVDAIRLAVEPGTLTATATDAIGFAQATVPVHATSTASVLLPLAVVARWASATHTSDLTTLRLAPKRSVIESGGCTAWTPAATGTFPPVQPANLDRGQSVPLDWQLRAALSTVGLDEPVVTLSIGSAFAEIAAAAVRVKVPIAKHRGANASIELDGVRFRKAVTAFAKLGQDVTIRYTGENEPVALHCGTTRYLQMAYKFRDPARVAA